MNLYILRHGLAEELDPRRFAKDSDRPLTSEGERKMWKIAEAIGALGVSFDVILFSPYVRARQTAEIVAEALGLRKRLEASEALTPAGSIKDLVTSINERKPRCEEVLLVGHEPYLSELISLLVSGEVGFSVVMKKGGLCKLSTNHLAHGRCATLEWLLAPKQMALMA
jgi:phosphohistidine phosphatase